MISIAPVSAAVSTLAEADGVPVPLSSRFNQALAESYVWAGRERDAILAAANNPDVASDPAQLNELQRRLEAYNIKTLFGSAMASHVTKAVETLVKS